MSGHRITRKKKTVANSSGYFEQAFKVGNGVTEAFV